tara:strand:+ start:210 stop:692 length:483 start_codon:yes stop_codon:yes gene_type:complete
MENSPVEDRNEVENAAVAPERTKRVLSEAQKVALENARSKALKVRQENASLRNKERELAKMERAKKAQDIEARFQALSKPEEEEIEEEEEDSEESEEEPPRPPPKKKRRPARRVIVTEVSSDSDSDVEVVLPREKRGRPKPTPEEQHYQKSYEKMFFHSI